MKLPEKFIDWLIRYAKKTPYFDLPGYMERWWLFKPRSWLPFRTRIHHILRSDNDRHLHDHPSDFWTLILRGGYWEHVPAPIYDSEEFIRLVVKGYQMTIDKNLEGKPFVSMRKWFGPGMWNVHKAKDFHRLEVPEGMTTWTLFTFGRYKQHWGFQVDDKKIYWREYLNEWELVDGEENMNPFKPKYVVRN